LQPLSMKAFFAELKRRNVIRIAIFYGAGAWLILQVADVLLEVIEAPEGSLRLVAIILALGFPFALILAWAFEITPEGIKREHEVDRNREELARSGRKLDIATIGLLSLAVALLAWQGFRGQAPSPDSERTAALEAPQPEGPRDLSIAVLPFVNMSIDPANEYFSDGLSEEVLNVLARMEDFRVAGRTSSFAFKGQPEDLRTIGERLGVANILEGSVRKQGDRVRVTAQLVDARSGYHLWSDTYDRQLDDVFAIQDDIATEVVRALRQALLPADEAVINQTAKGDVEAYNHFLRGQFHVRLRTRAGLERALEEFQQAILIDPGYAPPYAGIAMVYALLDNYNYRSLAETEPLAHRALDRALALDPQSDEAWAVRGLLLGQGPRAPQRREEARAALERAVAINPNNALAHLWLTSALYPDIEAMRASLQRAYELDPLAPIIVYRRAQDSLQAGDNEGFQRLQTELEEIAPDWFITWHSAGIAAQEQGRLADAALHLERALALNPEYATGAGRLAEVLAMLGDGERAEQLLETMVAQIDDDGPRIMLAAQRARGAILAGEMQRALSIYRPVVEAIEEPTVQQQADLAMLEASAGELAAAERRVRTALGLGPDELPAETDPDPNHFVAHVVLLNCLAARGELEAASRVAGMVREVLAGLRAAGVEQSYMPFLEGYLDHRAGRQGALEAGLAKAIEQGFRVPPGSFRWFLSYAAERLTVLRLEALMDEVLAVERARYREERAAQLERIGWSRAPFSYGSASRA
jgi:TolB-like protein/Tfp pilus assembly protein PilF